jgi:methionyl-tRNA synthetase
VCSSDLKGNRSANHFEISQAIFLALKQNGYLYTDRQFQWFAPSQNRFLPDRYVEGTCYICGYTNARSDQCDKCGNLLEPQKLINPISRIDNSTPELRETEHYYLDLGKLQNEVVAFLQQRESYWRPNVLRQSLGQILSEGLRGRPITRDLDWGIPVPIQGWQGKCLYVWFEAVIGYLSASIEWSKINGEPDAWRNWWHDSATRSYYFIGKDNIPFHAVIWPAQLIGAGKVFDELIGSSPAETLALPHDVPANEFMNLEGQKISGSRHWAVWAKDFLSRYDPDPLRYYLTAMMPEAKDTDWDWEDFYKRNNDELVATWGNLANRVLAFAYKNFEGKIPDPGELTGMDNELLQAVENGFETVAREMEAVHLRAALGEAMRLSAEVNRYLDQTAPWMAIKTDRQAAARAVYVALRAIDSLKILFAPFLPFSSEKLHTFFGNTAPLFGEQYTETHTDQLGEHRVLRYNGEQASGRWEPSQLKPGQPLNQPAPLFKKLEARIVEEERARLGKPA